MKTPHEITQGSSADELAYMVSIDGHVIERVETIRVMDEEEQ